MAKATKPIKKKAAKKKTNSSSSKSKRQRRTKTIDHDAEQLQAWERGEEIGSTDGESIDCAPDETEE